MRQRQDEGRTEHELQEEELNSVPAHREDRFHAESRAGGRANCCRLAHVSSSRKWFPGIFVVSCCLHPLEPSRTQRAVRLEKRSRLTAVSLD